MEFHWQAGAIWVAQIGVGTILLLTGFGIAFHMTFYMGWRNAFGKQDGLKTDAYFAWSRNPVYVSTWIGLAGWALIASSVLVTILLALWALLYLMAPLAEEAWLEQIYGDEYREYQSRVRRFF